MVSPVLSSESESRRDASESWQNHPLLAPWTGPYGGVPPFDRVNLDDFIPAARWAIADQLREVQLVVEDPRTPNFENTLVALERTGASLFRLLTVFEVYTATLNTPAMQEIDQVVSPMLVESNDALTQNTALFARLEAVYLGRHAAALTAEQLRLVEDYYRDYVGAGAKLDAPAKLVIAKINQGISELETQFSQNLLKDEENRWLELQTAEDAAGLPASLQAAFKASAQERELSTPAVVFNTRSAVEPFLEYSSRRDLRERVWTAFLNRGDNGDQYDNNSHVARLLALREESAVILGYPTYAHRALVSTMAKTPDAAADLVESFWPAALQQARLEIQALQDICDAERTAAGLPHFALEPWDFRYYAEKLRKAKYDIDAEELRPYLQLEQLLAGVIWIAKQLFDVQFTELAPGAVPVIHPDVRVFEVSRGQGAHVGLWYFDAYARKDKESGAWMTEYRKQQRLDGPITPIVSANTNFSKGPAGEAVLLSWDDAKTLFHEFGHGLHGLLSNAMYKELAGTEVSMDFVEFPSQLFERWLATPELLRRYARHCETGAPIPGELIEKVISSEIFLQGFKSVESIASALLDMRMHLQGSLVTDPKLFERELMAKLEMPTAIPPRHRAAHFGHVFSSAAYAATYYSYLWAEVLVADAWEAFLATGDPLDLNLAARLKEHVLSVGNTRNTADSYRAFLGRDPQVSALMRDRGFATVRA
jgi:peptidyl-dipeptidase Dcp